MVSVAWSLVMLKSEVLWLSKIKKMRLEIRPKISYTLS